MNDPSAILAGYFQLMNLNGAAHVYREAVRCGLLEALLEFEDSKELHGILGPRFSHVYLQLKRSEFEEFMRVISPWEREHLLLTV